MYVLAPDQALSVGQKELRHIRQGIRYDRLQGILLGNGCVQGAFIMLKAGAFESDIHSSTAPYSDCR